MVLNVWCVHVDKICLRINFSLQLVMSKIWLIILAALFNRASHYIFVLWFLSSIFFYLSFFYSWRNLSSRRLDVYHPLTHGVALVRI